MHALQVYLVVQWGSDRRGRVYRVLYIESVSVHVYTVRIQEGTRKNDIGRGLDVSSP